MPFQLEITVRFAETDAQGVAHHAAYLVWFETARVEYLRRFAGGYQALRDTGVEATTSEVHARYIRPVAFDDRLVIHTRCVEMRGARFKYEYTVERSGELVAEGWTRHACVDAKTMRPTSLTRTVPSGVSSRSGTPTFVATIVVVPSGLSTMLMSRN